MSFKHTFGEQGFYLLIVIYLLVSPPESSLGLKHEQSLDSSLLCYTIEFNIRINVENVFNMCNTFL